MMKFLTVQIILIAISIQQTFGFGESPIPSEAGTGFRKVNKGEIVGCDSNSSEHCFQVYPSVDKVSITNSQGLDIVCDPDSLCAFTFHPTKQELSAKINVNCLNFIGTPDGSRIEAIFGNWGPNSSNQEIYGQFTVFGNDASARWKSDHQFHDATAGPIQTNIQSESLITLCGTFPANK